jgi:hypothetical protein
MRALIRWSVAISCIGVLSHSAFAAQSSIAELVKQGYEIKGTIYVGSQDSKEADPTFARGQVLITFQRGQSIAVCQVTWTNWANIAGIGATSFTAADRCDIPGQP